METGEFMKISKEKEYIISGTINEIVSTLVSDFSLNTKEARFVTYVSIIEKKEKIILKEDELKLWYLNESIPNASPIFNLPYTISITNLKLEIYHSIYIFIGALILSQEVEVITLSLELIWILKKSIYKISQDEYCVYGRIIDFIHRIKRQSFKIEDIIPYDKNNECNRKPELWVCPYWNKDKCSLTEERLENILNNLEKKEVLTQINQYWQFVK